MLYWRDQEFCRSGLSKRTVPTFRFKEPGGNRASMSAWFTTGPFARNGSAGRFPARGPGSALLSGNWTVKKSENRPPENRPPDARPAEHRPRPANSTPLLELESEARPAGKREEDLPSCP